LKLSGIPTEYGFRIRELPRIDIHLDPVELRPLDVSLRLKEIPAVRAHFPVDYKLGFAAPKSPACGCAGRRRRSPSRTCPIRASCARSRG
jgi:hypothetical protein